MGETLCVNETERGGCNAQFGRKSDGFGSIDDAQRVAWELGTTAGSATARDLYRQLEAARLELESLRGVGRRIREELNPWIGLDPGLPDSDTSSH